MIVLNGHGQDYVIPLAIQKFGKKFQVPGIIVYLHWWNACKEELDTIDKGGKFETPFIHADECETSYSLALLPELCNMENSVDTKPTKLIPDGHVDNSAETSGNPIKWYNNYGFVGMEAICTPEGVIGKPSLAKMEKAKDGVEKTLDYIKKLHDDILKTFPAGKLPPTDKVTMRAKEDIEAVIKGPNNGGRHIYTLNY